MTIPRERTQAVLNTIEFLRELLDTKKTPRIPREIRSRAYWLLRHFPHEYEMEKVAKACPSVFGEVEEK